MTLNTLLGRCRRLEERAAALYRSFAAASRTEPALCALWTALAREEEQHARAVVEARERLERTAGWRTWIYGMATALAEVEERLTAAEDLAADAPTARQLSAALELEMSELETLRQLVLDACHDGHGARPDDHAMRLADAAEQLSDDPQVRLQAALLRARSKLKNGNGALRKSA